jgi:hypothetical protein
MAERDRPADNDATGDNQAARAFKAVKDRRLRQQWQFRVDDLDERSPPATPSGETDTTPPGPGHKREDR